MAPTYRDLFSSVKKEIREVSIEEVKRLIDEHAPLKLIDVREGDEYAQGRLPSATWVPRGFLEMRIEEKAKRDEAVIGESSIAAPIFDQSERAVGAIGVVGDTDRIFASASVRAATAAVIESARGVSRVLGATRWPGLAAG